MQHTSNHELETKNFAKQFATGLKGGDIVLLDGNLGAGKTTFVKGLAEGLGITEEILSPTFTLMNVYEVQSRPTGQAGSKFLVHRLIHVDTYRLKNEQELIDIGIEDYLGDAETVCVIEWPEKIARLLKDKNAVSVTIEHQEENKRKIVIAQ